MNLIVPQICSIFRTDLLQTVGLSKVKVFLVWTAVNPVPRASLSDEW